MYFIGLDAALRLREIVSVSEAAYDLLQFDSGGDLVAAGSADGKRLTGTVYFGGLDATTLTEGGNAVVASGDSAGGDLAGTYPSPDVAKIQGYAVQDHAPEDGEALLWNNSNSQYEPGSPSGSTPYYTVLDASATHTEINTALGAYDVVYLEPGTYSNVTGKITIPANKALLGLCVGNLSSATYAPVITLLCSATVHIEITNGGRLEHMHLVMSASSTDTFVQATNGICRYVYVKSATGTQFRYGFDGSFHEISHCSVYGLNGLNFKAAPTTQGGVPEISYFFWNGANAALTGILNNQSYVSIHDCDLRDGQYGLNCSGSHCRISNIRTNSNSTYGVYATGHYGTISSIQSYQDTSGVYVSGDYVSVQGITAYNSTTYGVYFANCNYATIGQITSYSPGSYGLYMNACQQTSVSSVSVQSGGNIGVYIINGASLSVSSVMVRYCRASASTHGVYVVSTNYGTFSGITAYDNQGSGIYFSSCTNLAVSALEAYGNDVDGVYMLSVDYSNFVGISTVSNGGDGLECGTGLDGVSITGLQTRSNTGYGWKAANTGGTANCQMNGILASDNGSGSTDVGTGWEVFTYGGSVTAHTLGGTSHSADTLANLNSKVTGGSLDFSTASRPPSGSASGDLTDTYPAPGVAKIQGYSMQSGAPAAKDIWQYSGTAWQHVTGLEPHYDSGWFAVHYSTANNVLKTHSLGVLPRQVQVYFSPNSNGNPCHLAGWVWSFYNAQILRGVIATDINTSTLRVRCGTDSLGCYETDGIGGTRISLGSGYARVLLWK